MVTIGAFARVLAAGLAVALLAGSPARALAPPEIEVVGVTPSGLVITCTVAAAGGGPAPYLYFIATTNCDNTMVSLRSVSTPHNHTLNRTYSGLDVSCNLCSRIPADAYVTCSSSTCDDVWSTHGSHTLQFVDGTVITVSGGQCSINMFTATCSTHKSFSV